jgi:hypothetical protein
MSDHTYCDGLHRRDFLRIGGLAGVGLSLSQYLQVAEAEETVRSAKGKAAIFIRLSGGPSHMDTFDLKPDAPVSHRGEFREIATKVPGIRFCEHLPKLAKCADKFVVLRGVSHTLADHRLGTKYLTTGNRPLPSLEYPGYGAVVSRELSGPKDLPTFVAVPGGEEATGFLGVEYGPLNTGQAPKAGRPLEIRGLSINGGLTLADLDRRQNLLKRFDHAFDSLGDEDKLLVGLDHFTQRAFAMIRSPKVRAALDLSKESPAISGLFSDHSFAQSCLLATRLVETGVRFVTVNHTGWDTHEQNFTKLKTDLLPPLDSGLSGLFLALSAKGLLESTTVFVTGEFGRTPKINGRGGRDHYPRAMFCLMAGGGLRGGQVVGASDKLGQAPQQQPITPDDVAATFYKTLGIDVTKMYRTPSGRPVMIVRNGKAIEELVG